MPLGNDKKSNGNGDRPLHKISPDLADSLGNSGLGDRYSGGTEQNEANSDPGDRYLLGAIGWL
jgi:hypothetical protein